MNYREVSERWGLAETASEASLPDRLARRIVELLENDPRALVAAMYRLDVGEARVAEALNAKDRALAARNLARAVLAREEKRYASRLQSRSGKLPM